MKTILFFLITILSIKENAVLKNEHSRECLLNVAEEVGAWLLLSAFLIGIFWMAGIL